MFGVLRYDNLKAAAKKMFPRRSPLRPPPMTGKAQSAPQSAWAATPTLWRASQAPLPKAIHGLPEHTARVARSYLTADLQVVLARFEVALKQLA